MTDSTQHRSVSIRLEGIVKTFQHNVKGVVSAVDNVNLEVQPGELLTLLGPSGCGKTTTLRMIAGFEHPSSGTIRIDGEDVTALRASERNIGFVFQNYAIFPHMSVFENVAYGLRVKKAPERELKAQVDDVLRLVGLAGYGGQQPHQLSGGEQQRVALARAIVFHPRILMFDEPLSNLDAKLRTEMRGEIRELQKRLGITAVYVTHDQEEAMAISDRIAVMKGGSIVQLGSAQELYHHPRNAFMANFIGKANLFSGRVTAVEVDGVVVDVLGQSVRCTPSGHGSDPLTIGADVRVVVRPEMLRLDRTAAGSPVARIEKRTFLGEKTEYEGLVGEQRFQASVFGGLARDSFTAGEDVRLLLPQRGNPVVID